MVGEIVFIEQAIKSPVNLEQFPEVNESDFLDLKDKQLSILKEAEEVELDEEESLLLYLIVDVVCRCFVSDANTLLEERALTIMDIGPEEYNKVRHSYIHYAQDLLGEMNTKFSKSEKFKDLHDRLSA